MQQEFDTEHSTKNAVTLNCRCRCQYEIGERLERERDDAVVELDGFKDDEFDASNKWHKHAIQITDSGCSKGHLSRDFR